MEFCILGQLEVRDGERRVEIGPPRARVVLALLLLHANELVQRDELVDVIWDGVPPASAKAALHNAIAGLRRTLGSSRIETVGQAYRIQTEPGELDVHRFEGLVGEASTAVSEAERAEKLRAALTLWRGPLLVDCPLDPALLGEIARLEELRQIAWEDRIDADLALGRHVALVPELEALSRVHPLRERIWRQLIVALYRADRQADALAAYRRAHRAFVEELGLEPGPALKELQRQVLVQDPGLEREGDQSTDVLARAAALLPAAAGRRAESLYEYAVALNRLGERARANTALEQAAAHAAVARDRGLQELIEVTLSHRRWVDAELSDEELLRRARQGVAFFERLGDTAKLSKALTVLANALGSAGLAIEQVDVLERAIALAIDARDTWQEGWCRNAMGLALAGSPVASDDVIEICIAHLAAVEWGTPGPLGLWLAMGSMHANRCEHDEASRWTDLAIVSASEGGVLGEVAFVTFWAASVADARGDVDLARVQLEESVELAATLGEARLVSAAKAELAFVLARDDDARAEAILAGRTDGAHGGRYAELRALEAAALVSSRAGRRRRAEDLASEAVALAEKTDWPMAQADALALLAGVVAGSEEATRSRERAARLYERKGSTLGLRRLSEAIEH